MAEVFLGAILQILFDKLASPEFLHFVCGDGVRSKLTKLTENLEMIQAVLDDAEEKQLTNKSVKLWLAKLQDLAYDVEDLVDEFATEDLRRKILAENSATLSSRMKKFIPARFTRLTPSAVKFDADMKSKIKAINSRLDELCKQRVSLGLQTVTGGTSSTAAATRQQRTITTSVPTEPVVYGRGNDKAKILEMVNRNEPMGDANFSVISIVGMGGIGKTTLARLVYNDETVNSFDLRAWVCVSDEFDVLRISKAILESITHSSCSLTELNLVQVKLKDLVAGKKFFLVLDDIWSKDYGLWETLKSPFMTGAPGSKMIVTTRLVEVASMMGTTDYHKLELLSDDDCWSLFLKHAVQSTSPDLELFREKVVKKCSGLPLAARTLGGLLRSKQRNEEWEQILNSKIWNMSDESGILPVLRISYHHLPSHLKRCFAYCAILPKDYEFEEEEVVLLWIAEGIVQRSEDCEQTEELGCEYFRDLLSMSMFQQSSSRSKFVMHDLINDLAQWASEDTCYRLEDEFGTNKLLKRLDKARRSSYICDYYEVKDKFEVFHKFEHLRTFLPIILYENFAVRFIANVVLSDLVPKLKRLRVLSLRNYYVFELPNSVGSLNHLRYLNLSSTMIKCLPESTSFLFNLQFLMLKECRRLTKLPSDLRNLINLRYLDISGANLIGEMPLGMKEMKSLRRLSKFIVGKGTGSGIEDLRSLKFLRGELCILRLENVIESQDIREALLKDKKNLEVLLLEWGCQFDHLRNEAAERNVLDVLQPQRDLKELKIKCYNGRVFPSWIGDPSFSKMGVLKLENCKNCTVLPSLGQLSSLKDLTITGMTGIKKIGSEMYGKNSMVPSFQSLESLYFEDLAEWKHWDPADEHVERFPRLRKLSIIKCPKLSERLPAHLSSLEKLMIQYCSQLLVSLSSVSKLCELTMIGCKRMACTSPTTELQLLKSMTLSNISDYGNWLRQGFPKVGSLEIVGFEDFGQLCQSEISIVETTQGLHSFTSLRDLCIRDCSRLVSFPDARLFSCLRELKVVNCYSLTSFPEGLLLECLTIEGCDSLTFLTKGQIPCFLKKLSIRRCSELRSVLDPRDYSCTSSSSPSSVLQFPESLKSLIIEWCPKLESIAKMFQNNSSLEYIHLANCDNLKFIPEGLHNLSFLQDININNCSSLVSLSEGGLHNLSCLQNIYIYKCSSLVSLSEGGLHNLSCLQNIYIYNCSSLVSLSEGGLHNLSCLQNIYIYNCSSLVSLSEGGLPITNLKVLCIHDCEKIKALPDRMHSLKSLKKLVLYGTSLISFPEEGFPTTLEELDISGQNICKSLFEWGIHKLNSLRFLSIGSCPHAVSFPDEEIGMMLPSSLINLNIADFQKLKRLSSKGFQNLTSLQYLWFYGCPNLTSFPEEGLPPSLLELRVNKCPLLKKQCKSDKGKEWSKIAHIPSVVMDDRSVHDIEEENIHSKTGIGL